METSSTVFKALDVLTIVTAYEEGVSLPDLAVALNQPRSNVVRIVRTLQQYGFVTQLGRLWIATTTFRSWSASTDRHHGFQRNYRPVLEALAAATGELVVLGLQEGNGILPLDAIESPDRACRAPLPRVRHSLRYSALGKLALSRRADLAVKFSDLAFQRELQEVRGNAVAWTRTDGMHATVAMAIPGFSNLPTEPMIGITWPEARFSKAAAEQARRVAATALVRFAPAGPESRPAAWLHETFPQELHAV